ncbi:MAG: cytochrome c maturation protein CcmE [Myxococcales bacterium FL481]|nr:MAG: cytochrome c maturation protein CcmE [Myxococcales bacterium FL481]
MALSTTVRVALVSAAVAAGAYLVFSDSGEGVLEYLYVEQVTAQPDHFAGREIKVHGVVVPGTVKQRKDAAGDYRFVIEHAGQTLNVHFANMVPDTFAEGGEVVLTGKLNAAGDTLESDEMTAKCPSKYEEKQDALGGAKPAQS